MRTSCGSLQLGFNACDPRHHLNPVRCKEPYNLGSPAHCWLKKIGEIRHQIVSIPQNIESGTDMHSPLALALTPRHGWPIDIFKFLFGKNPISQTPQGQAKQ
jgi:hypothetical protein